MRIKLPGHDTALHIEIDFVVAKTIAVATKKLADFAEPAVGNEIRIFWSEYNLIKDKVTEKECDGRSDYYSQCASDQ